MSTLQSLLTVSLVSLIIFVSLTNTVILLNINTLYILFNKHYLITIIIQSGLRILQVLIFRSYSYPTELPRFLGFRSQIVESALAFRMVLSYFVFSKFSHSSNHRFLVFLSRSANLEASGGEPVVVERSSFNRANLSSGVLPFPFVKHGVFYNVNRLS